jgi:cytochrome c biogenesis protein CcmG/thiol:disulfide interchange protein DsbE
VELPRLESLWKKYRDKGFSVVAIEATQDRKRAVQFIEKSGLTYHLLEAEEEKIVVKKNFGIKWFPTSYLIDRDGRIMICHVGFRAGDEVELEKEILRLAGTI